MSKNVKQTVEEMVSPILEEMNLELVEIEYVKEGKDWFLRVFIDSDTGVDIEDCGAVSEKLSEKMDAVDPIPHNYFLEVLIRITFDLTFSILGISILSTPS